MLIELCSSARSSHWRPRWLPTLPAPVSLAVYFLLNYFPDYFPAVKQFASHLRRSGKNPPAQPAMWRNGRPANQSAGRTGRTAKRPASHQRTAMAQGLITGADRSPAAFILDAVCRDRCSIFRQRSFWRSAGRYCLGQSSRCYRAWLKLREIVFRGIIHQAKSHSDPPRAHPQWADARRTSPRCVAR